LEKKGDLKRLHKILGEIEFEWFWIKNFKFSKWF
jgi:hypothetical protein